MLRSLLLLLSVTCLVSAGDFDLTVYERSLVNTITLRCEVAATGSLVDNPVFFLNDSLYLLPNRQDTANGVTFQVTRSTEGMYQCASDASVSPEDRSQRVPIVALPSGSNMIPVNPTLEFEFETGAIARLDCPILPGALRSQYYVTWRSAANNSMVFYEVFPPDRSARNFRFTDRYVIEDQNFSLYVREVTPGDMRFEYQCLLGVEDPQNPTMQGFTYNFAASLDLSLSILKPPEFIGQPRRQLVKNGRNVSFTCEVLSSPLSSLIQWRHRGRLIDPTTNRRYDIIPTSMLNSNQNVGGMITRSVLTIFNVTGFDSDSVQCEVRYGTQTSVVGMQKTVLSVLDVVEFQVIKLQIGGFILRARLRNPLQDPVKLRLFYTDTTNSSSTEDRQTDTQYFNTSLINHVVSNIDIPQFDSFNLSVSIVAEELEGPRASSSITFNSSVPNQLLLPASGPNYKAAFVVMTCIAGVLIMCCCCGITGLLILGRDQNAGDRNYYFCAAKDVVCCNCCGPSKSDQPKSGSATDGDEGDLIPESTAFSRKTAVRYVNNVGAMIQYGLEDKLIKYYLRMDKRIQDLPEELKKPAVADIEVEDDKDSEVDTDVDACYRANP